MVGNERIWSNIRVRTGTEVVKIRTIRSQFLSKTKFTESKCDRYYSPNQKDLVQTMMFAGLIWAILVLSSTFYFKRCVITDVVQNDKVDCPLVTMSGAKGRYQPSNNRGGNCLSEANFKGGTSGFEHVVFTYRKRIK